MLPDYDPYKDSPYCILHNVLLGIAKNLIEYTLFECKFPQLHKEQLEKRIKKYSNSSIPPMFDVYRYD